MNSLLRQTAWLAWIVGLLTVLSAGCGQPEPVLTYPVSGRLTIGGKPPPATGWVAMLHFEPAPPVNSPYPHPFPRAEIGPDGRFQFGTYGANDGAPAGKYKISFIDGEGKGIKVASQGERTIQVYWPTPIEIRPEGNELPPFDLKTK